MSLASGLKLTFQGREESGEEDGDENGGKENLRLEERREEG